ncbi:MAG: hypothetical protein JJV92_10835 [Desulfosarcina sp.]|nr:hypothetical protein [Desulfobacterales bacterium]
MSPFPIQPGSLVIGRDDNVTIIGLDDVLKAEESIASAIADSTMPAIMPDIEGGILNAVKDVPKLIKHNTRLFFKIDSFKREDILSFPEVPDL